MDHLSNFVAKQNVSRFRDQLTSEMDATRQAHLQKLLVEEEDRLGFGYEQLEGIEREIVKGDERIERQRMLVETMERAGREPSVATALLQNLMQIQSLYKQYRLTILAAIERNRL